MSEDDLRTLGASGVTHMGFGTESTSEPVLKLMNKRHQRVNEMYETARRAAIGGIRVTFNLIFGYPGETEEDRIVTLQTMNDIGRQFQNVSFSPNIFTPYPGIPIWPQLRTMNVPEPKTLREWGEMPLGANLLPWLQGQKKSKTWSSELTRVIVQHPVQWRIRTSRYDFPWELQLSRRLEKLVQRRSLVTGQELPTEAVSVC
jgi:anaerobic magnesium-protoporphyrin IX monomethyl ester cyclase